MTARPIAPPLEPRHPEDLAAEVQRYLLWLESKGYADKSVESRRFVLSCFSAWSLERGVSRPGHLTLEVLELYQRHLAQRPKEDGERLSTATQGQYLGYLRDFCRWLKRRRLVLVNPAAELELPRAGERIPMNVLSRSQLERLLAHPDVSTVVGLRDRAVLEVLYSTAIRRAELAGLELRDVDRDRGVVRIREGKYRKDRVVPIGQRALRWLEKWLREGRPELLSGPDDGYVFLSRFGDRMAPGRVTKLVADHLRASGVSSEGAAHLLRHTAATHMLEAGADLRYIQQLLGHATVEATQIYTRVAIRKLKEVHATTPLGAGLKHEQPAASADSAGAERRGPRILLDDVDEG